MTKPNLTNDKNANLKRIKYEPVVVCLDLNTKVPNYFLDKMAVKKSVQQKSDFVQAYRTNKEIDYCSWRPYFKHCLENGVDIIDIKNGMGVIEDYNVFSNIVLKFKLTDHHKFIDIMSRLSIKDIRELSCEIMSDRHFMSNIVQRSCRYFWYASDEFTNDREIVVTAVKQKGRALRYASIELQNDREIVMTAVKKDGHALKFTSHELKNDREIVMVAVKNSGYALQHASNELKNDREIVMTAIENDIKALDYASKELRCDVWMSSMIKSGETKIDE